MKRVISISFLLLANVIILAHAVIPHHHHDGLIFLLTAAHQEHDDHDGEQDHTCNYPPCHDGAEECLSSTLFVKLDQNKQLFQQDFEILPCVFSLFLDYSIPQIVDNVGLPFRQKPYLIFYHTEYISQSLGLRAPPIC